MREKTKSNTRWKKKKDWKMEKKDLDVAIRGRQTVIRERWTDKKMEGRIRCRNKRERKKNRYRDERKTNKKTRKKNRKWKEDFVDAMRGERIYIDRQ